MEEKSQMSENGTRMAVSSLAVLETSCSIRRSLNASDESPSRQYGKVSISPSSALLPERALHRSKTGTVHDSAVPCIKSSVGLVFLSLVSLVVVSVPFLNDRSGMSLSCPFAPPSEGRDRERGSSAPAGESKISIEVKTPSDGRKQSADYEEREEFAEDNCWSRSRHLLYRPDDRRLPSSPALERSLLEYEALQARCTSGKTWESMADLQPENSQDDCKYVIYMEGWEGLGNRLLSLVSAFAFSLSTDRVLLIDTRGHLASLLCEPFDSSSWKLPGSFPYAEAQAFHALGDVENYQNEVGINLNLRHQQSRRDQAFFCPETQERLKNVKWLAWNSNQYYVPRLLMVPALWMKLNPLFTNPSHLFSQLVRFLCLPANPIWAKTERTYQSYLLSSRKLVGLQVRAQLQHDFSPEVYDKVRSCLLGGGIVPNVSRHNSAPRHFFLRGKKSTGSERGTSIFVASLQREYYEALRDLYTDRGTEDGSLVSVHMMAYEGAERFTYDQAVKAYIDIWLLSFSDTLVTSGWSTFGYVAQGLAGVQPYMMNLREDAAPPFCYFGHSIEPCNHYPFLSKCGTTRKLSKEHESWVNAHLRPCQDESQGLQIV
ncbi:xyloglucan fucosyltransferase [Marchantia polymorpha subsp. ruderalis]